MITAVNHMHPSLGGAPLILPGQKKGGGGGEGGEVLKVNLQLNGFSFKMQHTTL